MRIKEGFVVREIENNIFIVPTKELTKRYNMMTINKTAKFVWELLENDITEDEIIKKLIQKYNIDENLARTEVQKFLSFLREKDILISDE